MAKGPPKKVPLPDIFEDMEGYAKALAQNFKADTYGMSEIEKLEYLLRRARDRVPRLQSFGERAVVTLENEYLNIAKLERRLEKARKRKKPRRTEQRMDGK